MRFLLAAFLITISSMASGATWQCNSSFGYVLNSNGQAVTLPNDPNDTLIIKFMPPNRMQVLKAQNQMEKTAYENMTWTQVGNSLFGQGIVQFGNIVYNLSEVLTDQESVLTAIAAGDPNTKAIMGTNKCQRIE